MSSTYSPILRTELINAGDQSGTWGTTSNNNFQYVFESAIAGYQVVPIAPDGSQNQVLTYVNGPTATPSATQAIFALLKLNPVTVSNNFNLFAPPVSKTFLIWNNTSHTATIYNSTIIGNTTAAGTGVSIPAGQTGQIWSDGTNFYLVSLTTNGSQTIPGSLTITSSVSAASATFAAPLPLTSGGTGTTVATGSGSVVLASSPALTGVPTSTTPSSSDNTTKIATTAFTQAAITSAVASAIAAVSSVVAGSIQMWPTASAPTGYLLCAGAAVSRTTYAALFAVIGTTFGAGDGSTTFNLPNYTNRMPYGTTIGATGGSADAVVVSHTHTATSTSTVTDPTHLHASTGNGAPNGAGGGVAMTGESDGGYNTTSASTGITVATSTTNTATGVSGTNANLPPYLGINFIIKT